MKKLKPIQSDKLFYTLIIMLEYKIKLLIMWYYKAKLYYNCHRDASEYYNYYNKILGLPAILINVFNTTFLLSNYNTFAPVFILSIAVLSLISALLSTFQNYFEFDKLKIQHSKFMIDYSKLLYIIENLLMEIKNNDSFILSQDQMNSILSSFEKLREEYIMFPEKIWKNNNKKFKSKLEEIDVNTSDSLNIILTSIKSKKNLFADITPKDDSEVITYQNSNVDNIDLAV